MFQYQKENHAAAWTQDYVFQQLIPYIGNKRKLLGLLQQSIEFTEVDPAKGDFSWICSPVPGWWRAWPSAWVSGSLPTIGNRTPYDINACHIGCNAGMPAVRRAWAAMQRALALLNQSGTP
jgi:adenine-specific DNA-methyltransferase